MTKQKRTIEPARIEESIQMINKYVEDDCVKPFVVVLEDLQKDPNNPEIFEQMKQSIDTLGITKGAVFTYAPYINLLLCDDPFSTLR
ncbi:MAG: hypothetical protein V3U71_13430 [Cocleimonas sp.]